MKESTKLIISAIVGALFVITLTFFASQRKLGGGFSETLITPDNMTNSSSTATDTTAVLAMAKNANAQFRALCAENEYPIDVWLEFGTASTTNYIENGYLLKRGECLTMYPGKFLFTGDIYIIASDTTVVGTVEY